MQTDGVMLYSAYQHMISKDIFRDEFFKPLENFIGLAKKIAIEKTGSGAYDFYENGNRLI